MRKMKKASGDAGKSIINIEAVRSYLIEVGVVM
jgi:hypothetical protein